MFNRSVFFAGDTVNSTNIKVNAVSGGIVKNHASSFFLRFHLKSTVAERLLSPSPFRRRKTTWQEEEDYKKEYGSWKDYKYIDIPVEVLQLVVVGDMEVVAEVIDIPNEEPHPKGDKE